MEDCIKGVLILQGISKDSNKSKGMPDSSFADKDEVVQSIEQWKKETGGKSQGVYYLNGDIDMMLISNNLLGWDIHVKFTAINRVVNQRILQIDNRTIEQFINQ